MEASVTQDNHALFTLSYEPLKGVIRHIGGVTRLPHYQAILVHQQAEFAPNNPAVVGHAFTSDLLRAAAFADGVHELNPIRVDDAEHGRRGQEGPRPVLMGLEEAEEPRALGEVGKQGPIVARQQRWNARLPTPLKACSTPG